jgi:serine/threonine-protein kinase
LLIDTIPEPSFETAMSKADSSQPNMPDLRIGSYRILQPLGLGGMSSVFRAVHTATGHEVALKVLPRALAKNPTLLQRFLREAKSAESLQHPNIVSIYDRGVDQGRHYLVLEFVPGSDFHDFIQRSGPLSIAESISAVKQVARGLAYAAGRGVIHRDVKPSNLLRTPSGQVKIIDLGLAVQAENEDERVTREGTTVGTVDYMAPEQARDSRATTIQSDMYSLGCAFYYFVTGNPPFPGGDITDKLSRHAKSPPPDPRVLRPEIPDSIAKIILRLLAKNPQDRFASYEDLIAELDATPQADRQESTGNPAVANAVDGTRSESRPSIAFASEGGSTFPTLIPLISLAELVAEHDEPSSRRGSRAVAGPPTRHTPTQFPSAVFSESDFDPAPNDEVSAGAAMPGWSSGSSQSSSDANWILAWVLIGTITVVIVIGLDQLIRRSIVAPDVVPAPAINVVVPPFGEARTIPDPPEKSTEGDKGRVQPRPKSSRGIRIPGDGRTLARTWREPGDSEPRLPRQRFYDAAFLAEFLPGWAAQPVSETVPGKKVMVRRIAESSDPNTASTLRQGLDLGRGVLELAGDGPFLIDDFRIPGASRIIRAAPGFRPIVQVERSDLEIVRQQPAVIVLDGKSLILDDLDLVVDMSGLSDQRPFSLFQCAGSNLTLRNCTVTLINRNRARVSFVRTLDSKTSPSRIRLEGTLVRGAVTSMFELRGGGDEVALDGSVILGGDGPILRSERFDPFVEQKISLIRSVLACRGPIVELLGILDADRSRPISIRALGSALGRFQGAGTASVIAASTMIEKMELAVDWRGEDNTFAGWKGYFASGPEPRVLVGEGDLRSTWNDSDQTSRTSPLGWGPLPELALAAPKDLTPYLIREGATLARVAHPSPYLLEKTVGSFLAPEIPQPTEPEPNQWTVGQGGPAMPSPGRTGVGGASIGESRTDPLDLVFSTRDTTFNGDLGAFISKMIPAGSSWARIVVQGTGRHRFTAVRLPVGFTLEIRVESTATSDAEWPSWTPDLGDADRPLIELTGGQLMLSKLRIDVPSESRISNVILIEDGHLVLRECRFLRRGGTESNAAALVNFQAPTTRPVSVAHGRSILNPQVDRPVCRLLGTILITDGTALTGELGRGLIALSDCAIAADRTAIELVPTEVARHRFDCDLWIDHCTLTSDQSILRAGAWYGAAPGPERPWIVHSSNSAYLAAYGSGTGQTVLLNGDSESLAHANYFWQGYNDALDVECYLASFDTTPAAGRTRDVMLQWVNYWGANHVRMPSGPRLSNQKPTTRLLTRLQPGRVEPSDLILDRDYHPGRPLLDLGADLGKLGIKPKQ